MDYPKVKVCLDTSEDNLIDELYTPCLKWAERFDRGVGYFTTGWLTYNVAGLSDFASRGGKMRLITSPILSTEDTDAIIGAENQDGSAFLRLEAALLENVEILKQEMEADIINTFSWMLYDGIIDMRFAIPCEKLEEGDFHDKFGIFYKGNDALSFSGSINDSKHGFQNYESIKVFKTWAGTQEYVDADTARFEKIWNRKDRNLKMFTIPQAVKNKIFELRSPDRPYSLPAGSSKWVHQDIAVKTFLEKEHGILAMATGTGKTVTAMKIINKLFDSGEIRRVVITMYGNDLLDQWAIQIRENYKNKQINYHYASQKMMKDFVMHPDDSILILSRDARNLSKLLDLFDRLPGDYRNDTLFVFDEVHGAEFSITVKFDDRQYKYFLSMNYKDGTVQVETSAPPKGREAGLRLPESIRGIFTPEFVRRFVFDGEQAAKSMDSSSNEADETIRYLYRLDELDEILAANQRILTEIQNAEGKRGTSSSLSNLRTRQSDIDAIRAKLRARCEKLREEIAAFEAEKVEKEKQRQELDKSYEKLNQEKNDILKEQQKNRGEIDVKITSILGIIKSPYLLSESLCARMFELGNSMKKLKLPKTIAKDFFTELASADRCVCDRCIGERERTAILKRADQYLGSDQQSVLNTVKSSLMDSVYDERLKKAFEELEELRAQANRLDTRFKTNEEKLIKAGGEKARELQERIEELIRLISIARDELERIESKDENDASLTEENNLHKADQKFKYYEQEIAKATRTNTALRKKELVDSLVNEIKLQATTALKQEIVRKTNEKLRRVIVDDYVEIESIDRYIKLKGRDGASEGQTLSIAYCFLGTLFEDSELEFPFIIDSPTGKMDFEKRQAVADIIPLVFNQMIAFVQSAEVERFANRFYANPDSQYLTVVASPQDQAVVVYEGIDFFDSYQREHKGDEK